VISAANGQSYDSSLRVEWSLERRLLIVARCSDVAAIAGKNPTTLRYASRALAFCRCHSARPRSRESRANLARKSPSSSLLRRKATLVRLSTDRVSTVLMCNLFALLICRSISMHQFSRTRRISTVQICSVGSYRSERQGGTPRTGAALHLLS